MLAFYYMARTAPRALSLQNYWEIPVRGPYALARARPEKAVRPLLGTRATPCDAILGDFIAFKDPSNLQPEK